MHLDHVHVNVRDLDVAVLWFETVLGATPSYRDGNMALFHFEGATVIVDRAAEDSQATLAFDVGDCDASYRDATARGAVPLEPPADKPWGVRSAYVKGPGALHVEFEQAIGGGDL